MLVFDEYENQARADLQQYYGIDLDVAFGGAHTPMHIVTLIEQLPGDSRLHKAYDQDAGWTLTDVLLAALLNQFRMFVWGMSDKKTRGPKPQAIGPSYMVDRKKTLPARVLSIDKLLEELNKPRG